MPLGKRQAAFVSVGYTGRDMLTIIAGSRVTDQYTALVGIHSCPWRGKITVVLSGCNKIKHPNGIITGMDYWGEEWAKAQGIPIERYPYLSQYGRAGGPIRNSRMAKAADAAIIIWDGRSTGSADMLKKAEARGLLLHVRTFAELVGEILG